MGVRDRERKICFVPDLFSWNRECVASTKNYCVGETKLFQCDYV